jgi:hypothetical protein
MQVELRRRLRMNFDGIHGINGEEKIGPKAPVAAARWAAVGRSEAFRGTVSATASFSRSER